MNTVLLFCALALFSTASVRSAAVDVETAVSADNRSAFGNKNVIEVPVVCKEGERPDANGKCRPIFGRAAVGALQAAMSEYLKCSVAPANPLCIKLLGGVVPISVVEVPITCPAGYRPDANGRCRPIHRSMGLDPMGLDPIVVD